MFYFSDGIKKCLQNTIHICTIHLFDADKVIYERSFIWQKPEPGNNAIPESPAFESGMQLHCMLNLKYSESTMNGYVTKKDGICIFTTDREEPRGKGFVRGRKHKESGESSCEPLSALIREFRGELVSSDKMILYPLVH